jgi:N-acetylneuraminic acid mutarotase
VRLNDGRLLVTGGVDAAGAVIASCEVYNPATNVFTPVANMNNIRAGHAAVTLADGRVMVAGGTNNYTDLTTAITNAVNTVEIWNPATNVWTNAPNLGGRRVVPALTLLGNGKVMVSGGVEVTLLFGIPIGVTSTNKTQLYTPSTNSWANGPNMPSGRAYHHESQVTLADGRVLMTGGVFVPDLVNALNATSIAAADIYNPTTNSWQATTMSRQRTGHSATRLPNGDVIVCGGAEGVVNSQVVINAVARFTPATNSWADLPALVEPRATHVARLLPDNSLVLLGPGTTSELLHF